MKKVSQVALILRASLNCEFQKLFDCGYILDDLARLRADADVTEVRKFVPISVTVVSDFDQRFEQPRYVSFGRFGKVG